MENLIANRSFMYDGSIDNIKRWLDQAGYATEDVFDHEQQPVVLQVLGLTVTGIFLKDGFTTQEGQTGRSGGFRQPAQPILRAFDRRFRPFCSRSEDTSNSQVLGTGIKIGYHRPLNAHDTGKPKVHLLHGSHLASTDPDRARRGLALYPKLYRRFRVKRR